MTSSPGRGPSAGQQEEDERGGSDGPCACACYTGSGPLEAVCGRGEERGEGGLQCQQEAFPWSPGTHWVRAAQCRAGLRTVDVGPG